MQRLRLIEDGAAEASWNMAVDEALLLGGDAATLRFYGWRPHAVSLGWFQRFVDFGDLPPGTAVVRRLTGGGAIHHGDELTFALVCDAARLPREIAAGYRLLHDAIVAALLELGVRCERLVDGSPPAARPEARWCFAEPGRDDVVTARGKLVGSAQRRIRAPHERVLHHGSIVLQRPELTPFVAAAGDDVLADATFVRRLRAALAARIADALSLDLAPGALEPAERALAARLQRERYADPAFVQRR